jgi:ABC-type sugar transport system permease subunit
VVLVPLAWTFWESLHAHDLRMPWQGRAFVGLDNYAEALESPALAGALARTAIFLFASVTLEIGLGFVLALLLNRLVRGRVAARAAALVPWAMPTVVAALAWRFLFDDRASGVGWLTHPIAAWVPLVLADVWKTTPFVALLLLTGLQTIDPRFYEAARLDGAGAWQRFWNVTLPLSRPALTVAVLFRSLDALRVFDLVVVLTGGGPGSATEPIALLAYSELLQNLRFGYGSALSVILFLIAVVLSAVYVRWLWPELAKGRR